MVRNRERRTLSALQSGRRQPWTGAPRLRRDSLQRLQSRRATRTLRARSAKWNAVADWTSSTFCPVPNNQNSSPPPSRVRDSRTPPRSGPTSKALTTPTGPTSSMNNTALGAVKHRAHRTRGRRPFGPGPAARSRRLRSRRSIEGSRSGPPSRRHLQRSALLSGSARAGRLRQCGRLGELQRPA